MLPFVIICLISLLIGVLISSYWKTGWYLQARIIGVLSIVILNAVGEAKFGLNWSDLFIAQIVCFSVGRLVVGLFVLKEKEGVC
jgi:hypothetical protein